MSKLDAQRAMREAKYARDSASGPTRREAAAAAAGHAAPPARTSTASAAAKSPGSPAAPTASTTPTASTSSATELCGHKSMNGRACTREAAHSEKNHRYS